MGSHDIRATTCLTGDRRLTNDRVGARKPNVVNGSFPAVQPISNIYTLSLWLAPEYEGQLSARR